MLSQSIVQNYIVHRTVPQLELCMTATVIAQQEEFIVQ